jgi:hypothetical protein
VYTIVKCLSTLEISVFFSAYSVTDLIAVLYIVVIERQRYILNIIASQYTFVLRFLNYLLLF